MNGLDPLQRHLIMNQLIPGKPDGPTVEWQIVGIFHTVKSRGSREDNPEIDVPFWQEAYSVSGVGVRTVTNPAEMIKTIATAVNAVDPQAALALARTMEQVHDEVLANDRFMLILFAGFAVAGLLLATVGIYGVMAFSATQRLHEMALRMALGATPKRVLGLVMKEGLTLACTGIGVGLIGAYFVGRAMQSVLFGIGTIDLSAIGIVGLLLLLAAMLACYLPSLRAATLEIMQLLRSE
jgi:ABC-type antimicrobial peptide transport system permease subunit